MATEYLTTDIDLKKVADGIRSRTGKTTPLAFPDGYVTEIGTLTNTSDATATASDIASGKTAYVKGEKVTGTMEASAGGDYNIAATTNADGTQNLAITDAAGGGGGSGGRPQVSLTITVDPTGAPDGWSLDVYGPSGSFFNFDANNLTFTIPDWTAGDVFAVFTYPDGQTGYLDRGNTVCVNCYFDITYSSEDYIANKSSPCVYACQIDETLSAGAEATMTLKFY